MTERERIVKEIADALKSIGYNDECPDVMDMADEALRVIERKPDPQKQDYSGSCTCGQSGYPEISPHSNHPHRKGCPQYSGKYDA
jgi:hypothetical protein